MKPEQGVLAVYSYLDTVIESVNKLKSNGFKEMRVFSPAPNHEIEALMDEPESPIRFFTLFGCLFGAVCGFAITILTSLDWPLFVSNKPIVSIPPFMVIVFEMTILFGALSTMFGLMINSFYRNKLPLTMYDPRFSDDKFGIMVVCDKENIEKVQEILNANGAEEIKIDSVEY